MRFSRVLAPAAAAALLTAGLAAPALADPGQNAKGGLYANNAFCGGAAVKTDLVGFANFHRPDPGTVSVEYHLKDAKPGTTYDVWLYEGFCTFDRFLGQVTANGNGVANLTVDVPVANPADTSFFTFSFGGGQTIESAAVTAG